MMIADFSSTGANPMAPRRALPHWWDMKLIGGLWIGTILLAIVAGLLLPVFQQFRATRAETLMAAVPVPIDGERAFGYLKAICEIGPRPAGSEANARQRKMVADHFRKMGATVREQPFSSQ